MQLETIGRTVLPNGETVRHIPAGLSVLEMRFVAQETYGQIFLHNLDHHGVIKALVFELQKDDSSPAALTPSEISPKIAIPRVDR